MIRWLSRPVVAALLTVGLTGLAAPAAFATSVSPAQLSTSCTGTTQTSVAPTAVTVTGSATCNGPATLALTTTMNTGGVVSSVTNLLPALPNIPLPINVPIPAVGVTSACSVLTNASSGGATISSSCSAG